ncbi:hypothetical protein DFH07DRAFT_958131 [Mycena maculata]|uniref:Uncharacterized protein n=1 Tax=Mycena maculata TaxID=230809 RepID=A0AAD7NFS7_9AGAR|nr:hypothetical protein DFH07DRAFT_958131 [Mycena maculata]
MTELSFRIGPTARSPVSEFPLDSQRASDTLPLLSPPTILPQEVNAIVGILDDTDQGGSDVRNLHQHIRVGPPDTFRVPACSPSRPSPLCRHSRSRWNSTAQWVFDTIAAILHSKHKFVSEPCPFEAITITYLPAWTYTPLRHVFSEADGAFTPGPLPASALETPLDSTAGIVDTAHPHCPDAFTKYQKATGAETASIRCLIKVAATQYTALENLDFIEPERPDLLPRTFHLRTAHDHRPYSFAG